MKLDLLRIDEPCPEDWSAMSGDDRARFCARCAITVTNLGELLREEAEATLARRAGSELVCVRVTYDASGKVVTRSTQRERFLAALRALAAVQGERSAP
jgi:hypothetical protein